MIELGSLRSLQDWANLDLARLGIRHRTVVIAAATLLTAAAFALSYSVYRHFGAPRNEYDLRIYYNALAGWRSGNGLFVPVVNDPVNGPLGFTYPPAAAILMSPMTVLPVRPVVILSSLGILVSTVGLVLLALRERVPLRRPQLAFAAALATAAAFCLQPISQTAAYGQVNTMLALLVMFDIFVLAKRKSRWAGIGIGLAMAVKLTPAIFLLYLIVSGQWRMLRVAIGTAVGVTLLAAMCAPVATWQYFTSLLWDSSRVGVLDNTANQSLNGTLARITAPLLPDTSVWLACALAIVAVGVVRVRRAVAAGDTLLAITVTGLLGVLVSPVSWIHHAVWIVPAMVVLIARLVSAFPGWSLLRAISGRAAFTQVDMAGRRAVRAWLGTAALTLTGLLAFVWNTRNTFDLPDAHYGGLGTWAVLCGSLQTLWMVCAVVFLPPRGLAGYRARAISLSIARVES